MRNVRIGLKLGGEGLTSGGYINSGTPEYILVYPPPKAEGYYKTTPRVLIVCGSQLGTSTWLIRLGSVRYHFEAYDHSNLFRGVHASGHQYIEHKRPREHLVQVCID